MKFTELNLDDRLMRGIEELRFETCTDVQAETFQHALRGRDVAVQSQTGTGKTAAFLISIFQLWLTDERFKDLKALVVAPTRELAVQIERDARAIGKHLPFRTGCFYGGVGYGAQEKAIAAGVQLIIGTPGRLLDFSQSGKLDFREVGLLVIDEADRLFDMGFYPDIRRIMRRARPQNERVTMLYSATLSNSVRNISWQFMNDPVEIEIAPEQVTVDTVEQSLYHVSKDEKFRLLLGILKKENPQNALIFCNTKRATEIVAKKLQLNGYPCEFIMGDLPQKKRIRLIDGMKGGELRMLCATDVAARGLHVEDLDMVVNYDLPEDPEAYVHRIGRTARAGKTGRAVSLACERFVYSLEPIQELIGKKIPVANVTADLIAEDESVGRHLPHLYEHSHKRGGDRRHPGPRSSRSGRQPTGAPADSRHPAPKHNPADVKPYPRSRKKAAVSSGPVQESSERGLSRSLSVEDRLAYYKRKYGEDFSEKGGSGTATKTARDTTRQPMESDGAPKVDRTKAASQKSRPDGKARSAAPATPGGNSAPSGLPADGAGKRKGGVRGLISRLFSGPERDGGADIDNRQSVK